MCVTGLSGLCDSFEDGEGCVERRGSVNFEVMLKLLTIFYFIL